jgi:hypothetical protein
MNADNEEDVRRNEQYLWFEGSFSRTIVCIRSLF